MKLTRGPERGLQVEERQNKELSDRPVILYVDRRVWNHSREDGSVEYTT